MNEHENKPVETTEEVVEDVTVDETTEQAVDYDSELTLRKSQRAHNKKGYEMRKQEKTQDDNEESIEEKMRRVIREERQAQQADNVQNHIASELGKIQDTSERELVADYYENTIRQSGTDANAIARDISLAKVLANRPRIQKENAEMKVAIKNRAGISNDNGGSNQDKPKSDTSKWSKAQLEDFKRRGITAEQVEATMVKNQNR